MTITKDSLRAKLELAGQQHLLAFWEELDDAGRQRLQQQINELDLDEIQRQKSRLAGASSDDSSKVAKKVLRAASPTAIRLRDPDAPYTASEAREAGESALRAGQLGMVLVAGGQGTRLGFDQPKGMYPLGPVSGRSLFRILIERLIAISRRYGTSIPLYLMTSPATHQATLDYLQQEQGCGLSQDEIRPFCQGTMPAVDDDGRILLAAKDEIALAPDGHGGMLAAMARSGCLEHAESRGIQHLFYGQIDNPLLQLCDPTLVGYHLLSESDVTTQVVSKAGPLERVGNVVSIDGRLQIVEYSDLPEQVARQTNADGSLKFWAGSIAVHIFALRFLQQAVDQAEALPFHLARKKVVCLDRDGIRQEPSEPNATKFERFIFDLLPHAGKAIVIEADREDAFAPVKNSNGSDSDSPEIAQRMMVQQHAGWLRSAGIEVTDGVQVEISPFFALEAADLAGKFPPDFKITEDTYLQ